MTHSMIRVAGALSLALALGAPPACARAQATRDKPMKMDEPMAGRMKKEGMVTGDVKAAAEKKEREMKDKLEKEEKAMSQGGAKK